MDENTELLNYIYQNCQMGKESLNQLIEIVEDQKFKIQLEKQLKEYEDLSNSTIVKLHELGHEEKSIGNMAKLATYMSISMKTILNKTSCHISEMLIQGSTMGIIDITKNLQKYSNANENILKIGNKLLTTEQNNIESLKSFLA